MQVKIITCLTL